MPVIRIDALCECEGCGKRFGIELDVAEELTATKDFEAVARETILNGGIAAAGYTWGVRGKATVERFPLSGFVTIQGSYMLCDECTKKCDDLPIDRVLTKEEVEQALRLNQGE